MESEESGKLLEETMKYYEGLKKPLSQELIVELLREIQDILGCVPADVQEEAAQASGVNRSVIESLIRIYPSLLTAPGRHRIVLCGGPSCASKDSFRILEAVKKELRDGAGGGRFILSTGPCLKRCRSGPNMRIDQDFYSCVKPEEIPDILKKYG